VVVTSGGLGATGIDEADDASVDAKRPEAGGSTKLKLGDVVITKAAKETASYDGKRGVITKVLSLKCRVSLQIGPCAGSEKDFPHTMHKLAPTAVNAALTGSSTRNALADSTEDARCQTAAKKQDSKELADEMFGTLGGL
jgi:hypothetical protein